MDTIAGTLKQYYDAFISQPRPLAFYSGLADYVGYVIETPALKSIADDAMQDKEKMFDELDLLEAKAVAEVEAAKKKIVKIIKDNKIDPTTLSSPFNFSVSPGLGRNPLERMQQYDDKELAVSGFKSDVLESFLFDIAAGIARSGRGDLVHEFEVTGTEYGHHYDDPDDDAAYRVAGNIQGNFIFSKTIIERVRQQARIDRCGDYGLWRAFNDLFKLHEAYGMRSKGFGSHNVMTKYLTGPGGRNQLENREIVDTMFIFEDLDVLANSDNFGKSIPASKEHDLQYLDEDIYKGHAARVHAHLLKELAMKKEEHPLENKGVSFNPARGILCVMGKEIKFRKFTEQYHTLGLIFSDPKDLRKEWFFSELAEKIDTVKEYDDKKFHNYLSAIKRRVSSETSIKDLFITTTQSVKINPDYLN